MEHKDGNKAKSDVEQLEEMFQITGNLSRAERRLLQRKKKQDKRLLRNQKPQVKLRGIEDIFDEADELGQLRSYLHQYQETQHQRQSLYRLHRIYTECGVSEESSKKMLIPGHDKTGLEAQLLRETDPNKFVANRKAIIKTQNSLKRSLPYVDDEEKLLVKQMDQEGAPVEDIFRESLRARQANIELLQMQIDYLEKEAKEKKLQEQEKTLVPPQTTPETVSNLQEKTASEELTPAEETLATKPFRLAGWEIYYSTQFWSDNPNHLERLPTDSREDAEQALSRLGRSNISIGIGSVIRALEFHLLDKDVIQKALSARNKYAPPVIRRWVKVKRGKDRIGILIDEYKPNRAVFFVGGRDEVYNNIN